MRLETNRLVIREFVPEDWESVHRYASDPKVTRYTLWGPNTEEETKDYVAGMKAMQQKEPRTQYEWAVIRKTDGELIGGCGINVSGSNGEIGYCFHADHWGQGYASECAKAMLEFGFRQLGGAPDLCDLPSGKYRVRAGHAEDRHANRRLSPRAYADEQRRLCEFLAVFDPVA